MTFEQYVDDVFFTHHYDGGLDEVEIQDLIEDSTWEKRYKWLKKIGYSYLEGDYKANLM